MIAFLTFSNTELVWIGLTLAALGVAVSTFRWWKHKR